MFKGFQQIAVNTAVAKTATALTFPSNTIISKVALQADTAGTVRYCMNGNTPTSSTGMVLNPGLAPQVFLAEDLQNIQFIAGTANTNLLIHYQQ